MSMHGIRATIQRARQFLVHDAWQDDPSQTSRKYGLLISLARVGQLVVRGYRDDNLSVHASALTLVCITSLVPLLAVGFALLKGFGFKEEQITRLLSFKNDMPEGFQTFVDNTIRIVNETNFAAMGWIGVVALLVTALMVMTSIERSFNSIWGVSTSRSFMRQVTNYVSVLVLIPLLLGVASTADIYIKTVTAWLPETMVGGAHKLLLTATTLGATWLALCALIRFVPNTAVHLMPAVISSLLTAFVFVGWQKIYIAMQIGVARFNAIYGTFAAIPIFLAWLYTSWVIILLGAELAFAIQNSATYEMEGAADKASFRARLTLALAVMRRAAMTTIGSQAPFTTDAFARENRVPIRLLNDIIRLLVRAGWLVRTAEPEGTYVLMKAPALITVREIVDTVLLDGAQSGQLGFSRLDESVEPILKTVVGEMNTHLDQATLLSLVQSPPALSAHGS